MRVARSVKDKRWLTVASENLLSGEENLDTDNCLGTENE
jgi:hypothetical protein